MNNEATVTPIEKSPTQGVRMFAIEDDLQELRTSNSVIESYAQLTSRVDDEAVTLQQVSAFLFIIFERQEKVLSDIEKSLHNRRSQYKQTTTRECVEEVNGTID